MEAPAVARSVAPPLTTHATKGAHATKVVMEPPATRSRWRGDQEVSGKVAAMETEGEGLVPRRRLDWVGRSPPWLVSTLLHMLFLMILAITATGGAKGLGDLIVSFSTGDGASEEALTTFDLPAEPAAAPSLTAIGDMASEMPIESVMEVSPSLNVSATGSMLTTSDVKVGDFFKGRSKGMKGALLSLHGGTSVTEGAVELGLKWLSRQQQRDGGWSLSGPYEYGAGQECRPAATAMAILAFQGAGHTDRAGDYQPLMKKAYEWMLRAQRRDGAYLENQGGARFMYGHAQCTIALCEAYAMTGDSRLREAAQAALHFCYEAQDRELGGWRYQPGIDSDTSVTGWFILALKSGRSAGLEIDEDCWTRASYYLDRVQLEEGAFYKYQAFQRDDGSTFMAAMTAEGLLCRMFYGWKPQLRPLQVGARALLTVPMDADPNETNVYYWYYATQLMHHLGEGYWDEWNGVMREYLPGLQIKAGREAGSWDPAKDHYGSFGGGRLYTTCLSIYCLEVYYRHMPLYDMEPKPAHAKGSAPRPQKDRSDDGAVGSDKKDSRARKADQS
jgi:hypothetical protein